MLKEDIEGLSASVREQIAEKFSSKRKCTDILFAPLILVLCAVLGYLAYVARTEGNTLALIRGQDSFGNICGMNNSERLRRYPQLKKSNMIGRDLRGYDKLYQYDFQQNSPSFFNVLTTMVCVKECPPSLLTVKNHKKFAQSGSGLCKYDVKNSRIFKGKGFKDACPPLPVYETSEEDNRCFPAKKHRKKCSDSSYKDQLFDALGDIVLNTGSLVYLSLIGLGLTILLMVFVLFLPAVFFYIMTVVMIIAILGLPVYFWYRYSVKGGILNFFSAVTLTISMIIFMFSAYFLFHQIKKIKKSFEDSSAVLKKFPSLFILPCFSLAIVSMLSVGLGSMCIDLLTSGKPNMDRNEFVSLESSDKNFYLRYLAIFICIWLYKFVLACQYLIVSGSISYWILSNEESYSWWSVRKSPIILSLKNLLRYNMGSAIFGSFLISLVTLFFLWLRLLHVTLKRYRISCCLCIFKCCTSFANNILKVFSNTAYTLVAMRGENLYKSGKKGVSLLFDESSSFIIALGTRYYLLAAELFVGSLVFVLGYALFNFQGRICEWRLPLFVISLFTFIMVSIFLENYGAIVETTYVCLLMVGSDMEEDDASPTENKESKKTMALGFIKRKNPIKAASSKLGSIFSDYGIKVPTDAVV